MGALIFRYLYKLFKLTHNFFPANYTFFPFFFNIEALIGFELYVFENEIGNIIKRINRFNPCQLSIPKN